MPAGISGGLAAPLAGLVCMQAHAAQDYCRSGWWFSGPRSAAQILRRA